METVMPSNPLAPSPQLLCKLGSVIVHAEELASPDGHDFDAVALKQLMGDAQVKEWLADMRSMAMIPEKRKA
jgi:hypothetical protein